MTNPLAATVLTHRNLNRFIAKHPPASLNNGSRPVGISRDGLLHATELLASEWNACRDMFR